MKDAKHGDKNFVKALKLEKQSLSVIKEETEIMSNKDVRQAIYDCSAYF